MRLSTTVCISFRTCPQDLSLTGVFLPFVCNPHMVLASLADSRVATVVLLCPPDDSPQQTCPQYHKPCFPPLQSEIEEIGISLQTQLNIIRLVVVLCQDYRQINSSWRDGKVRKRNKDHEEKKV